MYSGNKELNRTSEFDFSPFIQGTDVFNSKFLYLLKKIPTESYFIVGDFGNRIDLISQEIYDRPDLGDLLLLYNGLGSRDLTPNTQLRVIKFSNIRILFNQMSLTTNTRSFIKQLT